MIVIFFKSLKCFFKIIKFRYQFRQNQRFLVITLYCKTYGTSDSYILKRYNTSKRNIVVIIPYVIFNSLHRFITFNMRVHSQNFRIILIREPADHFKVPHLITSRDRLVNRIIKELVIIVHNIFVTASLYQSLQVFFINFTIINKINYECIQSFIWNVLLRIFYS